MRLVSAIICFLALSLTAVLPAQNDRGTITGEVKDQAGAVVPNAAVNRHQCREWNAESRTTTTGTGNYTIHFIDRRHVHALGRSGGIQEVCSGEY